MTFSPVTASSSFREGVSLPLVRRPLTDRVVAGCLRTLVLGALTAFLGCMIGFVVVVSRFVAASVRDRKAASDELRQWIESIKKEDTKG